MNKNIVKFAEICAKSRHVGLTTEEHLEKIEIANALVSEGVMTHNGSYQFINKKDGDYFLETIKNWTNEK